jgi:hypothetical protein
VRPTREIIIIVLAITVGAVVTSSIVGLLTIEAFHPDADTKDALSAAWDVAALMAGIVLGYLGARLGERRRGDK